MATVKITKPTEKQLTKHILQYLKARRIVAWKHWQGTVFSRHMNGIADILGILSDGRFLAIEVKRPGWKIPNETTKQYAHYARQKAFLDMIHEHGGLAFIATSLEDVVEMTHGYQHLGGA